MVPSSFQRKPVAGQQKAPHDRPSCRTAKAIAGQIEMDAPLYSPPALIAMRFIWPPRTGCTSSRQSLILNALRPPPAAGEALLVATNDRSYRECAGLQPRWRGVAKKSKSTGSCNIEEQSLSARSKGWHSMKKSPGTETNPPRLSSSCPTQIVEGLLDGTINLPNSGNGRRLHRRYPIGLRIRCRVRRTDRVVLGKIHDISSAASVLLHRDPGSRHEAGSFNRLARSVDHACRLQLKGWGRVLRSNQHGTAIEIESHEFYTRKIETVV